MPSRRNSREREIPGLVTWRPGLSLRDIENNVVIGDCLDVLSVLPDGCVDLIHTSPPYNIARPYVTHDDAGHPDNYFAFIDAVIREMKRVLKPNGSLFWQTGYTESDSDVAGDIQPLDIETYRLFRAEPRMALWDRIIWRYLGSMAFKRKFTNRHETILWWVRTDDREPRPTFNLDDLRERAREYDPRNNFWGRNPGNVWEVDRVAYGSSVQTSHIAVYPEEVSSRIVLAASNPGDLILDPFSGSGTTAKMAKLLNRRWLGIEISPQYATEAAIRVGFQAPGLASTLLSAIIRARVFNGQATVAPIQTVFDVCSNWLQDADAKAATSTLGELIQAGREGGKAKRSAWLQMDADAKSPDESLHPRIWEAVNLLRQDFRLLSEFNTVQQFRYALMAISDLQELNKQSPLDLVNALVAGEPSTFALVEGGLALRNPDRTVRSYSDLDVSALPRQLL